MTTFFVFAIVMYEKEVVKQGLPVERSVQNQLNFAYETFVGIMTSSSKELLTENSLSQPSI
jgi:hypothetical protein